MTSDAEWVRDVIAHINAFVAAGGDITGPDFPGIEPPELDDYMPPVDCLVCFGDDPECVWPHGLLSGDDGPPPSLDQLAEMYPADSGSECE
ncbi:MAG TPA: hypothetical protein VL551_28135 [Actinospica sp.]|jgi:hypothetical protein|nr:hypothetical protein [Actinospica sp.]